MNTPSYLRKQPLADDTLSAEAPLAVLAWAYASWLSEIAALDPWDDFSQAQRLLSTLHRELVALAFGVRERAPHLAAVAEQRAGEAAQLLAMTGDVAMDDEAVADLWNAIDGLVSALSDDSQMPP